VIKKLFLFLAFFIVVNGTIGLMTPVVYRKDARRAEVSREMALSKDYWNPTLLGEPFYTKPPLFYWLGAVIYQIFGMEHTGAIRLIHLVSSVMLLGFMMMWFRKRLTPEQLAAMGLMLFSMYLFQLHMFSADLDMLITLWTTISFFALVRYIETFQKRDLILGIITLGLGVLVKGPIAALFTVFPIFLWLVFSKKWSVFLKIHWFIVIAVGALALSPWLYYISNPLARLSMVSENAGPTSKFGAYPSLFYYTWNLMVCAMPWSFFLLFVLKESWREYRPYLLQILAVLFGMGLFPKHDIRYLLPVFPSLAYILAAHLPRFETVISKQRAFRILSTVLLILFAIVLAGVLYLVYFFSPATLVVILVLACSYAIVGHFVLPKPFYIQHVAILFLIFLIGNGVLAYHGGQRMRYEFFQNINTRFPHEKIYSYRVYNWGAALTLHRIVPIAKDDTALRELLKTSDSVLVLMMTDETEKKTPYPGLPFERVMVLKVTDFFNGKAHSKKFPNFVLPNHDFELLRVYS
jgi:4-amino-4-deoxy-L-arabinose transferase-like glycosyltransferase